MLAAIFFYSTRYYFIIKMFKGTVLRDLDGLLVVWMDRALFGDKPLQFLKFICYFMVFKGCSFKRYWGIPLANVSELLATLWQCFYCVSEGIGDPLTNSSVGTDKFCK
jgi:hypothetical protein